MLPEYMERYLADLAAALAALDRQAILALAEALMEARREGRQVLLMGNGGSAALASHMANDLNKLVVPSKRTGARCSAESGKAASNPARGHPDAQPDWRGEGIAGLCRRTHAPRRALDTPA